MLGSLRARKTLNSSARMPHHNHIKVMRNRIEVAPTFLQTVKETVDSEESPTDHFINGRSQSSEDSFREATRFPMLLGQWLCLIPVFRNKFEWISFKLLSLIVILMCQLGMAVLSFLWLNRGQLSVFKTGTVWFFGSAAFMMLSMVRLSYMWSELTKKWAEVESHFGYQKNLKVVFAIVSAIVMVYSTGAVEHLYSLLVDMFFATPENSKDIVVMIYASKMFPQVFEVIQCTLWRALAVLYVNSVCTLLYSFGDLMVIMVSLALGDYFKKYNKTVLALRGKAVSEVEWKTLRLKYTKLCELTYLVDDGLCHLLCFTFLIHVHGICLEMHQGMLYELDGWRRIHACLSFVSSGLRMCALCYATVRIYEQSRTVLELLYSVPSSSYRTEIELFIQQVLYSEVALTGSHMFSMKRRFLLTIGGTVVSYEILLMQMKDFSHYV